MIGATLDTNVLASGIAGAGRPHSTPGELFRRWRRGAFELVVSNHLLSELQRTLAKPYYRRRFTPDQVKRALASFRAHGRVTSISVPISGVATHPEDDLILATAVSGQVDYLVTGDRQLLALGSFRGVTILSPSDFLTILNQQAEPGTTSML